MDHFAGSAYIVIIAVDLDQARIGEPAVHIVPQAAVLLHDTVLHFRFGLRGIGIRGGFRVRSYRRITKDYSAEFVECVTHLR